MSIITVYLYKCNDDFDVPVAEFIAKLNAAVELVDEQHRSKIHIKFDPRGDASDYGCGVIELYYSRPENEKEKKQREDSERASALDYERRQRREYERLKAKYG